MVSDKQTYITKEGLAKLQAELEDLKSEKRKEIAERISTAKELGDLSENAEYAEAKRDQAFVEGRILELENVMRNVIIIEEEVHSEDGIVTVGSKIKIKEHADSGHVDREYHIVGSHEADPSSGKISNESPIGKALLGTKKGDTIEISLPKGTIKCEVVDIG